jgi:hypothetical protein
MRATFLRLAIAASAAASLCALTGCGGHTERTLKLRTALDQGNTREAIEACNEELDVKSGKELPNDLTGDNALIVLDRASIQQSIVQWKDSARDFEAADKAIDMLDLAHNAGDSIGEYVFSGSSGRYVAPPYEKLLINTLDMINYLELGDLSGAKVEARRLTVMQKYVAEQLNEPDNPVLGLGGFLAGLAFEKSGNADEALHYYDDALKFSGFHSIKDPARALMTQSSYKTQRLTALASDTTPLPPSLEEANEGELIVVAGYGRVPHKISNRVPIGLALTLFARDIHPTDAQAANKLAAQGLVTWINYPTLAPGQGSYETPRIVVDSKLVQVEEAVDISTQVRDEWHKVEGKIVASAITRLIARLAVGEGIQMAAGKDSIGGFIAALGTQAVLTALDTPDTRSWETLPARIAVARVRLPAGRHSIKLDARGVSRTETIDLPKGGWKLVSLMALR